MTTLLDEFGRPVAHPNKAIDTLLKERKVLLSRNQLRINDVSDSKISVEHAEKEIKNIGQKVNEITEALAKIGYVEEAEDLPVLVAG